MNRTNLLASAAALTLLATPVFAQDEGFYVGVGGGINAIHNTDIEGPAFGSNELNYDEGFVGTGIAGYKYDNGFRNELELGYRQNDIDEISDVNAVGETEVYSAMVNLLFDLDITDTNFDTYIGGGAGGAFIRQKNVGPANGTSVNDTELVPAIQGVAGISYALTNKADVYMNYQYFHAISPSYKTQNNLGVDSDYDSSSLMVGLKVNLSDVPEPVAERQPRPSELVATAYDPVVVTEPQYAPAPVASPISRTYIVFFDLDDSRVTNDARAILAQAAQDAQAGNAVSIQVVGHADTSGGDDYNRGLSQQRASSVKSALSSMGVNGNNMDTVARGESDLLVPTADGVKEPQNRRVEVTYIINP